MFVTTGEALVDRIVHADGRREDCLGGSVCNFARAVALQGWPVRYLNVLSADTHGDRFATQFQKDGVEPGASVRSACPTSLAVVTLGASGGASYVFHRVGVADRADGAVDLIGRLPDWVELIHTGGLALMPADAPKVCDVLVAARERGAVVSVDANLRPVVVGPDVEQQIAYRAAVLTVLGEADVLKLSDEDAVALGWSADDLGKLSAQLFERWPRLQLVAFTLGAAGAVLVNRSNQVRRPVPVGVRVVDTVGAGDCFQAALLVCLARAGRLTPSVLAQLSLEDLSAALGHAMAAATLNVQRQGCQPPTWEETCAAAEVLSPSTSASRAPAPSPPPPR